MDANLLECASAQAAFCKAVGSPRRLIILWMLSEEELSVNEIAQRVGSSVQNISQHLSLLKNSGILTSRRSGQMIFYQMAELDNMMRCPALLGAPESLEEIKTITNGKVARHSVSRPPRKNDQ